MSKSELSWAPAAGHDVEVLYAVDGPLGRIRLNRPRAINALDRASIDSLSAQLHTWADDDAIAAVVIDGAGDRGLCAGGDVRALREAVQAGNDEEALAYWAAEYAVNALIAIDAQKVGQWDTSGARSCCSRRQLMPAAFAANVNSPHTARGRLASLTRRPLCLWSHEA